MIKHTLTLGLVLVALAAGLAACGSSGGDGAAAQASKATGPAVSAQDNTFSPGTLKVHVGDTVTFTNDGGVDHTVTATSGAKFDSGSLAPGATFKFTAEKAGTVSYVCTFHPGMQGTIEVG
ncbi:MAG TPA: cupredoxin domain-containing protein [Solirubrobacteraceae bacterium]|jgi:plastocyanin|nr:cupredoxin domain-containing protein [Solirubrobacteraceae bacterium]